MALKIRLRQQGRTNRRVYRIVVADAKSPRDGKYVESLGWYNPFESEGEKHLSVNTERAQFWIGQGAQATEKAGALLLRAAPDMMKAQTQKSVEKKKAVRALKKK